ncbi:MAG: hypothetical protein H6727_13510 [Myxococcales bacterium]|nr:hypothetical protein [Myxococcales bacterium]
MTKTTKMLLWGLSCLMVLISSVGWAADGRRASGSRTILEMPRKKRPRYRRAKAKKPIPCGIWAKKLKRHHLMISSALRRQRIATALQGARVPKSIRQMARRYPQLLRIMEQERLCWQRAWSRTAKLAPAARKKQRRFILRNVAEHSRRALEEAILPMWIGTPWDFYGTAVRPHQKSIACGYFVTHALRSLGFRFPETFLYRSSQRGPMQIFEVAKLPAAKVIALYAPPSQQIYVSRRGPTALRPFLRRFGPGIYILALDTHIGLVLHHGPGKTYFWHSSYGEGWTGVVRESLYTSNDVRSSRVLVLGKVGWRAWTRWLQGKGFFARSVQ